MGDSEDRNRDDEMRPGSPPKSAYVPGSGAKEEPPVKTQTSPFTGEPNPVPPKPATSGDPRRSDTLGDPDAEGGAADTNRVGPRAPSGARRG